MNRVWGSGFQIGVKISEKRALKQVFTTSPQHRTQRIIYFYGFKDFLEVKINFKTFFKKWINKIDVFSLDWEKKLSIKVSKLLFWKYLLFKSLTVKGLYHKRYQRYIFSLHSLLIYYIERIYSILYYILKAAYNNSIFLVTLYFSASF